MKGSDWLGITVGTLTAALGLWFGLLAIQTSRSTGLLIISVGIIFAMYAMAALSGVGDVGTVAFQAALYAIVTATALVVAFMATRSPSYLVAAPTMAIGVGGAIGLPPSGISYRTLFRVSAVGIATVAVVLVYWVDHTVYALIAPLLALPAVGLGDRAFEKGRVVLAEPNDQR